MIYLHQIDPVAIHFPAFTVFGQVFQPSLHWYGLAYFCSFLLAWWLGRRRIVAGFLPGVGAQQFGDLMYYGILGVILGGRLGYVLFYSFTDFLANPGMIVRIWEGGMSFHGGLLGVLVAAWLWARQQRMHLIDVMDFLAPLAPIGLGLGRLANFIGAELWGKYTGAGWGVVFPSDPALWGQSSGQLQQAFASGALDAFARHPSQLYQAVLEGLTMWCVLWWFSSQSRPRYAVSGLFALLYGMFRFAVEFVRVPDADLGYLAFGWLTMGQLLSLPLVGLGLFWLWYSRRSPQIARARVRHQAEDKPL